MSGPNLAEWLMRHRAETKVLFMSGYTEDAEVLRGVLEHNLNFLQKPFTSTSLARGVLEGRSLNRPPIRSRSGSAAGIPCCSDPGPGSRAAR